MKNRDNSTRRKILRWTIAISLVIIVLAGVSCDLVFPKSGPNINEFIEAYWGIDVTNSGQITAAILGMKLAGNEEAANGLTAYSHCRSELYQERGDKLLNQGNTDEARQQYTKALEWAVTDTAQRASDKVSIYYNFGNTYVKDAGKETDLARIMALLRAAGQNNILAAKTAVNEDAKAFYYRNAAFYLAEGGDKKNAQKAFEQAEELEPDDPAIFELRRLLKL